jgi:hypothetical protein
MYIYIYIFMGMYSIHMYACCTYATSPHGYCQKLEIFLSGILYCILGISDEPESSKLEIVWTGKNVRCNP